MKFDFISAGQGIRWRDAILGFHPGDIFAAYLKGHGYVGIGQIVEKTHRIHDVRVAGKPLLSLSLRCKDMGNHSDSKEKVGACVPCGMAEDIPQNQSEVEAQIQALHITAGPGLSRWTAADGLVPGRAVRTGHQEADCVGAGALPTVRMR